MRAKAYIRVVHKNGGKAFLVRFKHRGKDIRRKFPSKSLAERFKRQIETVHATQGVETTFALFSVSAGQRDDAIKALSILKTRSIPKSLVEIVNFYLSRNQPSGGDKLLKDAITEYLKAKEGAKRSEDYLKTLGYCLRKFERSFLKKKLHELDTPEIIESWLDLNANGAPTTRKNYIRDVGAVFRFAVKRGWCTVNPFDVLERPILHEKPVEIFSIQEVQRLFQVVGKNASFQPLTPFLALGFFAGLRTCELKRLDWSEVQLARRFVEITAPKAKCRSRRIVDISENLTAWLTPYLKAQGRVIPTNFDDLRERLCKTAGIRWKKNVMRHCFGSYHLTQIKDPGKTAHQMGHRDTQMLFRHYRELVTPEDASTYWNIRLSRECQILPYPNNHAKREKLCYYCESLEPTFPPAYKEKGASEQQPSKL